MLSLAKEMEHPDSNVIGGIKMQKNVGHPETDELDGKKIRYHYESGMTYDQEYQKGIIIWTGIEGPHVGYGQTEKKVVYKVADNIYFLAWFEQETRPSATAEKRSEGFNIAIVADLNKMIATAIYNEPVEGGGQKWMRDKAWLEFL
jgi:hypothetical protein